MKALISAQAFVYYAASMIVYAVLHVVMDIGMIWALLAGMWAGFWSARNWIRNTP